MPGTAAADAAAGGGGRGRGGGRRAANVAAVMSGEAQPAPQVAARGRRPRPRRRRARCPVARTARGIRQALAELDAKFPPAARANVKDFVNHIDYAVKKIGIDHVGISSDFDGGGGIDGWNGADETFNVTLELVRRGYTEATDRQDLERQPAARDGRGPEGRAKTTEGTGLTGYGCFFRETTPPSKHTAHAGERINTRSIHPAADRPVIVVEHVAHPQDEAHFLKQRIPRADVERRPARRF